jgi:hypothetical protein
MIAGTLESLEYSRQQFSRDPGPAAEGLAWVSGSVCFSSSVSGLQTADLECDLGPHSGNPVYRDLAQRALWGSPFEPVKHESASLSIVHQWDAQNKSYEQFGIGFV